MNGEYTAPCNHLLIPGSLISLLIFNGILSPIIGLSAYLNLSDCLYCTKMCL